MVLGATLGRLKCTFARGARRCVFHCFSLFSAPAACFLFLYFVRTPGEAIWVHKDTVQIIFLFFCASGEAVLGTQRYLSKLLLMFFRAPGELIKYTTTRHVSKHFLVFLSRLRRGGFRYTTILYKVFPNVFSRLRRGD